MRPTATASADDTTICRAPIARHLESLLLLVLAGGCVLPSAAGCTRTAVIVDRPPPHTTTVVTVHHIPQTQPSDKDLVIRAAD